MSFREIALRTSPDVAVVRREEEQQPRRIPKIRACSPPPEEDAEMRRPAPRRKSAAVRRRSSAAVVSSSDSSSAASSEDAARVRRKYMKMRRKDDGRRFSGTATARQQQQHHRPPSDFSQLTHRTQKFQRLVADLEVALEQSGESPHQAWRARIMMQSAEETDQDLSRSLNSYRRAVEARDGSAVAACLKLHRDFQRSHQALVNALAVNERRQRAEVSRLGAVDNQTGTLQEDFFDRAMRERQEELERMNSSMHKVHDIYQDLAGLIDLQQDKVDRMARDVGDARDNVEAAARHAGCFVDRQRMCGALAFADSIELAPSVDMVSKQQQHRLRRSASADQPSIRVSESFNWYMPFETLSEDMKSVQKDIVGLGKDIIQSSGFKCGSIMEH